MKLLETLSLASKLISREFEEFVIKVDQELGYINSRSSDLTVHVYNYIEYVAALSLRNYMI